ncbi:MAG: CHAT domain-containing protein [Calothrix sp. C42_A2020_038]|nr:CHAT domain-containing protein [Calothrix sp. C42_A2020_038]
MICKPLVLFLIIFCGLHQIQVSWQKPISINFFVKNLDSISLPEIKEIAKLQNATIVQYSILPEEKTIESKLQPQESELLIWVIKPTGKIFMRRIDLKSRNNKKSSLPELIRKHQLNTKNNYIVNSNLQELHQILIQPIAELLPLKPEENVIFIPQGQLFNVPFAALQDEDNKYLIEKHTISTSPSIQVLDLLAQRRNKNLNQRQNQQVLIVGSSIIPNQPLKPSEQLKQIPSLHSAENEAKAIIDIYNTNIKKVLHLTSLLGADATETKVVQLIPKTRIIHFATQGYLEDSLENSSVLAFATTKQDDGWLTNNEVSKLKLNAELVVLSSNSSALGKITLDGVIGMPRAFLAAGADSVVGSLWNTNNLSTVTLMTEFHRNISKNPDKAVALRQAMLVTMKQYPNPWDWAGFTLIGLP